ncbi:MAG: hypothetical protein R6V60_17240 [Desulfobacterales bacterium]
MSHCFPWPDREGETATISHVVQYFDGDVVLIPERGPGITLQPADLSAYSLDRLIAGVLTLADYARNNADRLDGTAERLTLMRPVVK